MLSEEVVRREERSERAGAASDCSTALLDRVLLRDRLDRERGVRERVEVAGELDA